MKRFLKDAVKNLFRRYEYHIVYSPRAKGIPGFHFAEDIRELIPKKHPVCFDVGANEGQTIALLRAALDEPRLYAFEPSTKVFRQLQAKGYDSSVTLVHAALGDRDGEEVLHNYDLSVLSSLLPLVGNKENPFHDVGEAERETVKLQKLDTFVSENGIGHIDLLKIDTQGYDLHVLRGAEETLKRKAVDFLYVELNFVKLYEGQADSLRLIEYLGGLGYHLVDFYEKIHHDGILSWCTGLFSRRGVGG